MTVPAISIRYVSYYIVCGLLVGLLALSGCGDDGDVGDSCDTAGVEDECVDGALCTNEDDGNVCRVICDDQDDCAENENCSGVASTTINTCQPRD